MSIDDELQAAGQRVADRPVDAPPLLGDLQREVQRRRNNVRFAGGVSVAALLLLGGATATLASLDGDVQVVSSAPASEGSGQAEVGDIGVDESSDDRSGADGSGPEGRDGADGSDADDGDHSYSYQFSSRSSEASASWDRWWTSVEYASGDDADAKAAEAEAAADETRIVDGQEIWIERFERDGVEAVAVSSLREGHFTKLSGPVTLEDKLIASVTGDHRDHSYEEWGEYAEKWEEYAEKWTDFAEDLAEKLKDHGYDPDSIPDLESGPKFGFGFEYDGSDDHWDDAEDWDYAEDWESWIEEWQEHTKELGEHAKDLEEHTEEWEKHAEEWEKQAEKWADWFGGEGWVPESD